MIEKAQLGLKNSGDPSYCDSVHDCDIPSAGRFGPTVIDKSQPIESIESRLRDHTRTFDSGVRARTLTC